MIGPEVTENDVPSSVFSMKTSHGAEIKFILVKDDYKSYARSKQYLEPTLVAALNCGFIFYKSWDASLDFMVRKTGAPLVFTEYYLEDCKLNLEKLKKNSKKNVEIVLEPSENPFCSRYNTQSLMTTSNNI